MALQIDVQPNQIKAGEDLEITLTIKDEAGNPLNAQRVKLKVKPSLGNVNPAELDTDAAGMVKATLTATVASGGKDIVIDVTADKLQGTATLASLAPTTAVDKLIAKMQELQRTKADSARLEEELLNMQKALTTKAKVQAVPEEIQKTAEAYRNASPKLSREISDLKLDVKALEQEFKDKLSDGQRKEIQDLYGRLNTGKKTKEEQVKKLGDELAQLQTKDKAQAEAVLKEQERILTEAKSVSVTLQKAVDALIESQAELAKRPRDGLKDRYAAYFSFLELQDKVSAQLVLDDPDKYQKDLEAKWRSTEDAVAKLDDAKVKVSTKQAELDGAKKDLERSVVQRGAAVDEYLSVVVAA